MASRDCACALSLLFTISGAAPAAADYLDIGLFENTGQGNISYTGSYGQWITSERQGNNNQYTVIHVDLTGLLEFAGAAGFTAVRVIDHGDNIYTSAPGADIDLMELRGLDPGRSITWLYDGPTTMHQTETSEQLFSRVQVLDWGTNGGLLTSNEFVSLGQFGHLTAQLDGAQYLGLGNGDGPPLSNLWLDISEAGNAERFHIAIDVIAAPSPGAMALLALAGAMSARSRRRASA